jgi:hypothetical protein
MPLCPQITNTPVTVVQNADFTVSSVLPVVAATTTQLAATNAEVAAAAAAAAAAASAAAAAQTAASAALAEAGTAYTTAVNSLQASAYAIQNPTTKQLTAIDATGLTVYSGASSTTGSRVVLNSLGLAAYGPGNSYTISNAVGNGTTVTYTASGHNFAVGSSVTVSDLAPAGYNGTFLVTAIAGSSTFTVANTTTATLTDASGIAFGPGRSVNITNAVGNGSSVTYTASNHGYSVGTSVNVSGLAPDGYNGTFLITSVVANTSFTVSNGTTATLTDASGVAQTPTLAISATTGNAVFQGSVTGSTIIGGTLNIAGKAVIDSTGLLTATGATITGTINAQSGFFGIGSNGWSISTTGLVSTNSATIVGGAISGTSITTNSGTIAGWSLTTDSLTNVGADTFLFSNPGSDGVAYSTIGRGIMRRLLLNGASGTTLGTATLAVGGDTVIDGTIVSGGTITSRSGLVVDTSVTFGITNQFLYLSSSGTLRSAFTYGKAVTGRSMQINSAGDFGTTASTLRKKHDVEPYAIDSSKLLQLQTKTFKYLPEIDDKQEQQYGFIAEEAEALGLLPLILYNEEGQVDYFAYEKLPIFLLQLAQEQEARIQALEGE